SVEQAARGQELYKVQCARCHGNTLEGGSGPSLAGATFLSNWSAQPLANFVDKIQKTMPFNLPGSLSRSQSVDLTAYILQAGKFPGGEGALPKTAFGLFVFPAEKSPPARGLRGGLSFSPPEGNLAELMREIASPNENIILNMQLKVPATQPKKQPAAAPF